MQDYADFLRRTRWKTLTKDTQQRKHGKYLNMVWIDAPTIQSKYHEHVADATGYLTLLARAYLKKLGLYQSFELLLMTIKY
jgi:hypothetical protein